MAGNAPGLHASGGHNSAVLKALPAVASPVPILRLHAGSPMAFPPCSYAKLGGCGGTRSPKLLEGLPLRAPRCEFPSAPRLANAIMHPHTRSNAWRGTQKSRFHRPESSGNETALLLPGEIIPAQYDEIPAQTREWLPFLPCFQIRSATQNIARVQQPQL